MAHATSAIIDMPEATPTVEMSIGVIAERLMSSIRNSGQEMDSSQRGLLERALSVAAEAEQRMAEQSRRIALLETMAMTDEITGLMNRRGFDRELKRHLAACRRHQETGALVIIDLDDFKTINDVYGHLAGDRVLRTIGQLLLLQVRECDTVARVGGDEFAVLLGRCTLEDGVQRAEAIEGILNEHFVNFAGTAIPVRGSVGITPLEPGDDSDAVFRRADEAMYVKKHARGRLRTGGAMPLMFRRPIVGAND